MYDTRIPTVQPAISGYPHTSCYQRYYFPRAVYVFLLDKARNKQLLYCCGYCWQSWRKHCTPAVIRHCQAGPPSARPSPSILPGRHVETGSLSISTSLCLANQTLSIPILCALSEETQRIGWHFVYKIYLPPPMDSIIDNRCPYLC